MKDKDITLVVLLIHFHIKTMYMFLVFLLQFVFDRIQGSFTHKLWRVRDEVLICLQNTVNT